MPKTILERSTTGNRLVRKTMGISQSVGVSPFSQTVHFRFTSEDGRYDYYAYIDFDMVKQAMKYVEKYEDKKDK